MIIVSFVVAIITGGTYLTKGLAAALLPPAILLAFYFRSQIAAFLKAKETHTVALKVSGIVTEISVFFVKSILVIAMLSLVACFSYRGKNTWCAPRRRRGRYRF